MANQYTKRKDVEERLREKAARQEMAGIPDSKSFTAENPALEAERAANRAVLSRCHVGGKPWAELPEEAQNHIRFEMTDEGIAAAGGKVYEDVDDYNRSRTVVTREQVDMSDRDVADHRDPEKAFQQLGDARIAFDDSRHTRRFSPLDRLSQQNCPPGHATYWMSDQSVRMGGSGFELVLVDGKPVQVGDLYLTSKPAHIVERERAEERADHAAMLKAIGEETKEQNERVGVERSKSQRVADVLPTSGLPATFGFRETRGDLESHYQQQQR